VYESWMIFMKIWLFHPVCRLLYLVCVVSRSEVLASVLCFRLGLVWRFCFTTADFSWLVLLLATRSASLASSFSPWSTRSFQSLFSGSEIFGFSLLSEVRCQDFVLYSVHLVLADFLHRSVPCCQSTGQIRKSFLLVSQRVGRSTC
jgi:hypothetical protein